MAVLVRKKMWDRQVLKPMTSCEFFPIYRKEPGLIHTMNALQLAVWLVGKSGLEGCIKVFCKRRKDTSQWGQYKPFGYDILKCAWKCYVLCVEIFVSTGKNYFSNSVLCNTTLLVTPLVTTYIVLLFFFFSILFFSHLLLRYYLAKLLHYTRIYEVGSCILFQLLQLE